MNELDLNLKPLFVSAYVTGIRKGELTPIQWPQVDFETSLINLDPDKTKTGEGRTVPIFEWGYEGLSFGSQKGARRTVAGFALGLQLRGKANYRLRISWANACKRAGVPDLKFHDLRPTAVRNM